MKKYSLTPGPLAAYSSTTLISEPKILQYKYSFDALIEEFEKLKREPVLDSELQRAKNQWARDYILGRESVQEKALHLAHAAVIHNDITTADGEFDIFMNVTSAEMQSVAQKYFTETNRVVLHILPRGNR